MRYILSILTIFLFAGATESPDEKRLPWHRSFYAEMKKLEKPARVQAFSAVQTATNTTYGGTSCVVTTSSSTANNLFVVSIFILSTYTVTSITDNQSNSYEIGSALTIASAYNLYQSFGFQTTGGTTSVTVNISGSTEFLVIVDEYSGFTGTPTNAECADNSSTGSQYGNTGSVTSFNTVQSGCLIVGSIINDNIYTISAGTGYTKYGISDYYGLPDLLATQYKLSSSTSETAPYTLSGSATNAEISRSYKQEDWVPASNTGKAIRSAGN